MHDLFFLRHHVLKERRHESTDCDHCLLRRDVHSDVCGAELLACQLISDPLHLVHRRDEACSVKSRLALVRRIVQPEPVRILVVVDILVTVVPCRGAAAVCPGEPRLRRAAMRCAVTCYPELTAMPVSDSGAAQRAIRCASATTCGTGTLASACIRCHARCARCTMFTTSQ